jgi:hypothetical protein
MTEMALRSGLMNGENMGGRDTGLTLKGLAQRLETLERENAELRHKVATLEGSDTRREQVETASETASETGGLVSRRALLSKAGVAVVGLVAAGALTQRDIRHAQASPTVFQTTTADRGAVETVNSSSAGIGVLGYSTIGVRGEGTKAGVFGITDQTGNPGVSGVNTFSGYGVLADGKGPEYAGVLGRNSDGTGVWGKSSKTGYSGVYGQHTGSLGFGIVGDGVGAAGAGILGRNNGGDGVRGEGTNGVHAKATSGYGGLFEGGKAQLRIVPKGSAGKPTSGAHTKGEIYMDSAGALFVCTANGTPGMWKKVTTTTA